MTDTTLAGLMFEATMEAALQDPQECAHSQFPEVLEQEWLCNMISGMIYALGDMLHDSSVTLDRLTSAAEHAFITAVAGGIAAGKAMASEEMSDVLDLDSIEWGNLPDVLGGE